MRVLKLLLLLITASLALPGLANHVIGGNISYECLGADTYGITLTYYKDCYGSTSPTPTDNIFFFPTSGPCTLAFSAQADLLNEVEISDLCPTELVNSSCNGGIIPGVNEVTYYVEVYLDPTCAWDIVWNAGDWAQMANIDYSGLPNAYILTHLNPALGCGDSAIITTPIDVPYVCVGEAVSHQITLDLPAGYTADFDFGNLLTDAGGNTPGYNAAEPIAGITIDTVTGQIDFTAPIIFGTYVVAVAINIYDAGGNLVGIMIENIGFEVRACIGSTTEFVIPEITSAHPDVILISDNEASVCVGDSLCLTVEAENLNIFRTISLTSDFLVQFPTEDEDINGLNPATDEMCLLANESMIGTTIVTIDAVDDACPIPGEDQIQLTINVLPSAEVNLMDTVVCNGQPLDITASGDTDFTWTLTSGTDPGFVQGSPNQSINPNAPFTADVIATNGNPLCTTQGSISVDVSLWSIDGVVVDETCIGNDGEINLSVQGGTGTYDYDWEAGTYTTEDITGITGGQDWAVTVTNNGISNGLPYQCEETTTFTVNSSPAPTASISSDATICDGDCADITFAFTGTAPFDVVLMNMNTGIAEATASLNDGETFSVCPNVTTVYELQSATDSNVPSCSYTVVSSVTVTVLPLPTATFLDPGALCDGGNFDLEIDIVPTGTAFNVDYSIDALAQGTISMTDGDVIGLLAADPAVTATITNIEYADAPNCPNATPAELIIDVSPLPTAVLSGGTTICEGDDVTLHISSTGTGPWTIEYTEAGVAVAMALNVPDPEWDWVISPGSSTDTEYCITSITDAGTNCTASISSCQTVAFNAAPSGSMSTDGTICNGDDYPITLTLTTNGPYTIDVQDSGGGGVNGSPFVANNGDIILVSPNADETYCLLSITDNNECTTALNDCITVTVNPLPTIDITDATSICLGDCQNVPLAGMTGTPPFNVTWELHATDDDALIETATELGVINGDTFSACPEEDAYVLITSITDSNVPACSSTNNLQQYTIDVNTYTTVSVGTDQVVCEGTNPVLDFCFTNYDPADLLTVDLNNGQGFAVLGADLVADCWSFTVNMADPAVGETFTITALTNSNNTCTQIDAANSVDISVAPVPTGTILDDQTICVGDNANITVEIPTVGGPFDIEIQEGALLPVEYLGVVDGDLLVITPGSSATYTLVSITDNTTTAACTSNPGSLITITVAASPQFDLPADILCSNTGEEFTYTFGIQGGDAGTYVVTPTLGNDPGGSDPNAAGPPYSYTSGNIPTGSGEIWEITDANGCPPNIIEVAPYDCPIFTYSGTNDLTAAYICNNGSLTVAHNLDEILDGNDVLNFIIQDVGADGALGTVYDISQTGIWNIPGDLTIPGDVDFDTQYYVAAVAGDDVDMDGFIDDLSNPNVSISAGAPVTFLEAPSATISGNATICEGQETTIQVAFTGSMNYNFELALDGVLQGPIDGFDQAIYTTQVTAAGIYTLVDVDNTYCNGVMIGSAEIIVNPLPTASISMDGEICDGDNYDFNIDLTGAGPWDIIIEYLGGAGPVPTNVDDIVVSPLVYTANQQGSYYVSYIIDDNGCESDGNSNQNNLVVNPLPTATFNTLDDSFCSGSDFELSIAVSGTPDLTITNTLNAVPGLDWIASGDPYVFNVSTGGTYCIESVTDDNGCSTTAQDCVNVEDIPIPIADAGADIVVCSGIDVLAGTLDDPTLSYEWTGEIEILNDPLIGQPTVNILNETGSNVQYNLTLTVNDDACSDTDDLLVTIQPQPDANAGPDFQICWGEVYQLNATGGVSCLWEDNGTFIDPVDICDPQVQPTVDTEYVVTVTDLNGCVFNDTVEIIVPEEHLVSETFPLSLCLENNCVGEITLTAEGGWGVNTIDWIDFANQSFVQTNVCDGSYDYTVTDEFGCEIEGTIIIGLFPQNFIDDITIAAPDCFGTSTGIVTVHDNQALNWTQEDGETNFTGDFYDLSAGTYTYITQDINGCLADSTVLIESISPEITFNTSFDTTTVCVETQVDFLAVAGGGIEPFQYNWYDDVPPTGVYVGTGGIFSDTPSDSPYTVWVVGTDAQGCNTDTLSMTAVNDPPIEVIATPSSQIEICQGDCVDMSAIATGGNGNVNLSWWEFDVFGDIYISDGSELTDCPMAVTTYIALGEDGCQHPATDTVFVIVRETPDVEFSVDFLEGCFPTTLTFTNDTELELIESCLWDLNNGDLANICGELEYTYTSPGEYWPTLTVTSEYGCSNTDSLDVVIVIHDYPIADFEWEPNPVSTLENEVHFVNTSIGAVSYNWDIAGMLTTQWPNPSFTFPPEDMSTFPVCLEAISIEGCADTICKDIFIESVLLLYAPNAFTPDQDGLNDVFLPVISGITSDSYIFRIFDRWGHIVFETNQVNDPWLGDFQFGTYYVQNDVYIWQIEARELKTGDMKRFTGNVTIAR